MTNVISVSTILQSYQRISDQVRETRLVLDETHHLWLKCEQEQKTGSFKWRGALSKLSLLRQGSLVVTASTGNHGLAIATAAPLFDLRVKIFVPSSTAFSKLEKIKKTGAEVVEINGDSLSAELAGKKFARKNNLPWISPYNDAEVISGQGTIGIELDRQLADIERIYITVGGGGLVSGIASWLKQHHPEIEIIGCQPENSPEMYLSILTGHVVTFPDASETLSDGSAGPLESDSITYPICRTLIDRFVLISEDEIKYAMRYLYATHGMVIEGAAGVAMAAAIKENEHRGRTVVVLCGGNIDPEVHRSICRL